jgi:AP-1-like factor
MAEIEKTCDGGDDDYGLPGAPKKTKVEQSDGGKFISCNNIWCVSSPLPRDGLLTDARIRTQLQSNPDFQDGKFDLDGLCSELRVKAKCSESGVMVDQEHVHAALKKLGQGRHQGKPLDVPPLMFEQDSW